MRKLFLFLLTFVLMFGSALGVYAAENNTYNFNGNTLNMTAFNYNTGSKLGTLDSIAESYGRNIYLFKDGSSYHIFYSDVTFKSNGINLYATGSGTVRHLYYNSSNGYWYLKDNPFSVSATGTINGYHVDKFIWSTANVYDDDGKLVLRADENFIMPPLQMATEEALQEMAKTMGGMMKTLVLCGVGCLASLVALKLFGKRSLIFRS